MMLSTILTVAAIWAVISVIVIAVCLAILVNETQ